MRARSFDTVLAIRPEVIHYEKLLGLSQEQRWTPLSLEYVHALQYIERRNFHLALDVVEKLVVQRLLELHKLNASRIGKSFSINPCTAQANYVFLCVAYASRQNISKSLKKRSIALRKAIDRYNALAKPLGRAGLTWDAVSKCNFLENCAILRDTRIDMTKTRWGDVLKQVVLKKWHRVQRAKEELIRCNVELLRLLTYIRDESAFLTQLVAKLDRARDPLAALVRDYATRRHRVNMNLQARLNHVRLLEGFTGARTGLGVHTGASPFPPRNSTPDRQADFLQDGSSAWTVQTYEEELDHEYAYEMARQHEHTEEVLEVSRELQAENEELEVIKNNDEAMEALDNFVDVCGQIT